MELIDRYIYAVTKRLPKRQREDIDKELRSLFDDMISERCAKRAPDKSDIESIINELGDPARLAAKYRDDKGYLIGPDYYYTYMYLLRIVVAAVAFGTGLAATINIIASGQTDIAEGISEIIASVISGAFQGFAWLTVIFAINERFLNKKVDLKKDGWNVSELPEIPKKEETIKPADPVAGIIFSIIFLVIFSFGSRLFGIYSFNGDGTLSIIPVFSDDGILKFIPFIIALCCLSILKESMKLIIGRWNLMLGGVTVVLNIVSLVLCISIFTNPSVWNPNLARDLYEANIVPSDFDLYRLWDGIRHGFIYVVAFGLIIDSVVAISKGLRYSR